MSRTTYVIRNGELVEKSNPQPLTIQPLPPGEYTAVIDHIGFDIATSVMTFGKLSNVEPVRK